MTTLINDKIKSAAVTQKFPSLRTTAFASIDKQGFPTTKNEEWKYTSLDKIISASYRDVFAAQHNHIAQQNISTLPFINNGDVVIVLENGQFRNDLCDVKNLPPGISISSLNENENNEIVKAHFNKYVAIDKHPLAALNTALMQDGVFIHIDKNAVIEKNIYVLHFSSSNGEAVSNYTRLLLVAESGCKANISCITLSHSETTQSLNNIVAEIVVDENADVTFDFIQNDNLLSNQITNTYAYQKRDSTFCINTITFGNKLTRNNLALNLDAENCEAHMYGLIAGNGEQLMDNHTEVYHAKPHCNSNQIYKSLMGGKSTGVFNGKIFVLLDAQKTNAYQSSKNILMSNDAVMYTKPQLEIFADDVKCSHGATTGQMDDAALFYLRARGINKPEAQALLNKAFASDVMEHISNQVLKEYCDALLQSKI